MYEDIKSIIGKILGFFLWMVFFSFVIGYTLGNYYALQATLEAPRMFQFRVAIGYMILRIQNPDIPKFSKNRETK